MERVETSEKSPLNVLLLGELIPIIIAAFYRARFYNWFEQFFKGICYHFDLF